MRSTIAVSLGHHKRITVLWFKGWDSPQIGALLKMRPASVIHHINGLCTCAKHLESNGRKR